MTGHQYSAPRLYIDSYLVCLRRRQPTAHGDCVPPWLPGCRTATEAAVGSERIHLRSGSSELHMALGLRKPLASASCPPALPESRPWAPRCDRYCCWITFLVTQQYG